MPNKQVKYTGTTLLTMGRYRGTALINVPAVYLLNLESKYIHARLRKYIQDNRLELLKKEL